MERGDGHEVPALAEELSANDSFWEREKEKKTEIFFLSVSPRVGQSFSTGKLHI